MNQKNAKEAATVRPGSGWARIDQALADCPNVYIVAVIFLTALTVRTILLGRAELWEDEILYAHRVSPPDYTPWKLLSHRFTHFAPAWISSPGPTGIPQLSGF